MKISRYLAEHLHKSGILRDESLNEAICKIDRSRFVLPEYKDRAHMNVVLPSKKKGFAVESTSTQPSLVVEMIQALDLSGSENVLDVGTGTGYGTALLSYLLNQGKVVTIEYDEELLNEAKENLNTLGFSETTFICKDGYDGAEEYSPFNCIISMVASGTIPPNWFKQLKINGIMVFPLVVDRFFTPVMRLKKVNDKELSGEKLSDAVFMAMKGHQDPEYNFSIHRKIDLVFDGMEFKEK
ncbi:MAG: protein-L-isoaspartate O-methyltransferase [Thermotogota bacterium]|nr:protein-L-isoaspartate O-methyltransferase [Thermotogota bacterium]